MAEYLTTTQLAAALGYSAWWVRFLARAGRLPSARIGNGRHLFDPGEVRRALAVQSKGATPEAPREAGEGCEPVGGPHQETAAPGNRNAGDPGEPCVVGQAPTDAVDVHATHDTQPDPTQPTATGAAQPRPNAWAEYSRRQRAAVA